MGTTSTKDLDSSLSSSFLPSPRRCSPPHFLPGQLLAVREPKALWKLIRDGLLTLSLKALSLSSWESHSLYSAKTCPVHSGFFAPAILLICNVFPSSIYLDLLLLHPRSGSDAISCRMPSCLPRMSPVILGICEVA